MGGGVYPHAAFEAGEEVGEHGGCVEGGVGAEVDDDLRGGCGLRLRLAGDVGVDHGLGHEADELQDVGAGGVVALVVLDEV